MTLKDLPIGAICLVQYWSTLKPPKLLYECQIVEFSPSKEHIKLKINGVQSWHAWNAYTLVEVLAK